MFVMLISFFSFVISIPTCIDIFAMRDASVRFGMLLTAYCEATLWALLSLIVSFALYFVNCLLFPDFLFTLLLMSLLSFYLLGTRCTQFIGILLIFAPILILFLTLLNVNSGIKALLVEITLPRLSNTITISTLFSLAHQLILEFYILRLLFNNTETLLFFELEKFLNFPYPTASLTGFFVSLVSSYYNHFVLSCNIISSHLNSLKHAVTSILVPKRSRWVCREALYSFTTPGHLLSPHFFLNYQHIIKYFLYVKQSSPIYRNHLSILWHNILLLKWGPFFRLRNAAKFFAITIEDPFVFVIQDTAYFLDEPLEYLKDLIRYFYR